MYRNLKGATLYLHQSEEGLQCLLVHVVYLAVEHLFDQQQSECQDHLGVVVQLKGVVFEHFHWQLDHDVVVDTLDLLGVVKTFQERVFVEYLLLSLASALPEGATLFSRPPL